MPRSKLQLTTEEIDEEIAQHDYPDQEDAKTVDDVVATLDVINADIIEYLDLHEDAIDDGAHEIVYEDDESIVLATSGHFWREQSSAMDGIDDDILKMMITNLHHVAAQNRCEHELNVPETIVIAKPEATQQGEQHVLREIARRTDELGSVARAVDTFAVESHGWKQSQWAKITGRNESTVSRMTDN